MAKLPKYTDADVADFEKSYNTQHGITTPSTAAASKQSTIPDDISDDLKDVAIGAGQGLTFGGGTKALAAMQASYDLLTGKNKEDTKWDDLYKKYKEENEQSLETSKKRSPILTTGGEIAGAVLSPINKLAKPISNLAGLGEAAGVGGSLARGAVEGGALGGIVGGINQAPQETMPHAVLTGALTGAGAGLAGNAAFEAGGAALKGLKNLAINPQTQYGKTSAALYDMGKAGQGISSDTSLNEITKRNSQTAADAARTLVAPLPEKGSTSTGPLSQREAVRAEYNDVLNNHPEPISIPEVQGSSLEALNDFVNKTPQSFSGPKGVELKRKLNEALSGNISARDAHQLKLDIYGSPLSAEPATRDLFKGAAGELENTLSSNVEGYAQANKDWKTHNQIVESLNGVPADLNQKYASNDPTLRNTVTNKFNELIQGLNAPGVTKQGPKGDWNNFKDTIDNIALTNPSFIEKYGQFLPDLKKQIENKAIIQGATRVVQGTGQFGSAGEFVGSLSPRSLYYQGANIAGQIAGANPGGWGSIGRAGQTAANIANWPTSKLKAISDTLSKKQSTSSLGSGLKESLDNPENNMSRTAALFSIMQNPNSRKEVKDEGNK